MGIFNGKTKEGNLFVNLDYIEGINGLTKNTPVKLTHNRQDGKIEIKPSLSKQSPYTLDTYKISDIQYLSSREIYEKGKSVVGRAAVGSLLFGPVGALVGGVSGTGKKQKSKLKHFVIITYLSDWEEKTIIFEESTAQIHLGKFISEIKAAANIGEISREL